MAAHTQNRSNRKGLASWNRWKSFAGRGSTEREQWHTLTRNVAWEIALSSKVWSVRHIFVREMYLSLKRNIAMPVVLGTQGVWSSNDLPTATLNHWMTELSFLYPSTITYCYFPKQVQMIDAFLSAPFFSFFLSKGLFISLSNTNEGHKLARVDCSLQFQKEMVQKEIWKIGRLWSSRIVRIRRKNDFVARISTKILCSASVCSWLFFDLSKTYIWSHS